MRMGSIVFVMVFMVPFALLASPADDEFEEGRKAFNAKDYDSAKRHYIRSVQYDSSQALPYLHLADTYYVLKEYDMAVVMYDVYIIKSEDDPQLEKAKSRRNGANLKRTEPETAPQLPMSQTEPLEAIRKQLLTGPYLTADNGGAWALFSTLLRSGYAMPDLNDIRADLVRGLLGEAEGMWTYQDGPLPQLTGANWDLLLRHYSNAQQLGYPTSDDLALLARMLTAEGFIAYFQQSYDRALHVFEQARQNDPTLQEACWGYMLVNYAMATPVSYDKAFEAARALDSELREKGERNVWLLLFMGVNLQTKNDHESAGAYFHQILYPE